MNRRPTATGASTAPEASACSACRSARRSSAPPLKSSRLRARAPRSSYAWQRRRTQSQAMADTKTPRLRVLLADDHVTVRHGLKLIIEGQPDMTVVAEVSDGEAAIERAVALKPDVVVMDISMPGVNGLF